MVPALDLALGPSSSGFQKNQYGRWCGLTHSTKKAHFCFLKKIGNWAGLFVTFFFIAHSNFDLPLYNRALAMRGIFNLNHIKLHDTVV